MEKKLLASSPPENLNRPPEKRNLDKTLVQSEGDTENKKLSTNTQICFHSGVSPPKTLKIFNLEEYLPILGMDPGALKVF